MVHQQPYGYISSFKVLSTTQQKLKTKKRHVNYKIKALIRVCKTKDQHELSE